MFDGNDFLNYISTGIVVLDPDLKILYLNGTASKLLNPEGRDLDGIFLQDLFKSDDFIENLLVETLQYGTQKIVQEWIYNNAQGEKFVLNLSTSPLVDESGTIFGAAFSFRKIPKHEWKNSSTISTFQIGKFRSCSQAMKKALENFDVISNVNSTILISGATGTGKEILARTIHEHGPRKNKPFIAVNCGALPEPLLESELFGYKAGAFTGASRDKPGRFALAEGGTLFLDEIGEISQAMQVRLLRVLQERIFEPVGAIYPEKTNIRVIAATHADLKKMVKMGYFRSDLFYRLNVIHLEIPPLKDRKEDIELLSSYFIAEFNVSLNKKVSGISDPVLEIFYQYDWPGNIRELQNVLERSMVFCQNALIEPHDLPSELVDASLRCNAKKDNSTFAEAVRNSELQAIQAALEKCGGNRRKAAELLGIHPTSLYRKLKAAQK